MKDFIADNYILFLVISIILAFSMIGYFAESDKKKNPQKYIKKTKEEHNPLADIKPGMTLGDVIVNNKSNDGDNSQKTKEEVLIVEEPK